MVSMAAADGDGEEMVLTSRRELERLRRLERAARQMAEALQSIRDFERRHFGED